MISVIATVLYFKTNVINIEKTDQFSHRYFKTKQQILSVIKYNDIFFINLSIFSFLLILMYG